MVWLGLVFFGWVCVGFECFLSVLECFLSFQVRVRVRVRVRG